MQPSSVGTPGQVEELVTDATDTEVAYTNGYLAQYALDLAKRLSPSPSLIKQGGGAKEILRTRFMSVKAGHSTPAEEADKVYAALTAQDPLFSTGKDRSKNEIVDPPRVKEFEKGFSKQSILESEDERVMAALNEASQEGGGYPSSIKPKKVEATCKEGEPEGPYGIFCEPIDQKSEPYWHSKIARNYERAVSDADFKNRKNKSCNYYAKPLPSGKRRGGVWTSPLPSI